MSKANYSRKTYTINMPHYFNANSGDTYKRVYGKALRAIDDTPGWDKDPQWPLKPEA
jgi:hypothetical protein